MKDVSRLYGRLPPRAAAVVAWGMPTPDAVEAIRSAQPRYRYCAPHPDFARTYGWLQSVQHFWIVGHMHLLLSHAKRMANLLIVETDADLIAAAADVLAIEARLMASDEALDAFSAQHGIDPQTFRDHAILARFEPSAPTVQADADFVALLMGHFAELTEIRP